MKQVFANRLFLSNLIADLLSNFGDILYYMALMVYVVKLPQANLALALVSISETLPNFSRLLIFPQADKTRHKVRGIQLTLLFRIILFVILGGIMSFTPALWIVVVAAILNFLADIAGQYENALYIPIELRIIPDNDRQAFFGFSQSASMTAQLIFQGIGAVFITWFSYSQLAFLNAFTFLIPLLIITLNKTRIDNYFIDRPLTLNDNPSEANAFKSMKESLIKAIHELQKIPDFQTSLTIILVLNGILSSLSILITLMMSQDKSTIIVNPATTLALFNTIILTGSVLGGLLTMSLLKNLATVTAIRLAVGLTFLLFLAFSLKNTYVALFMLFPLGIIAGSLNPKLNTLIYNEIDEGLLTTVSGGIATYFQLGVVSMKWILSGLVLVAPAQFIGYALALLSLLTLGYTMKKQTIRK